MSYVLLVNVLVSQLNKSVWTSKHIKLQQVKLHIKLLLKSLLQLLLLLLIVVQVFCFQRVVAYEAPQISTLMIFIHAYQRTLLCIFCRTLYFTLFMSEASPMRKATYGNLCPPYFTYIFIVFRVSTM